MHVYLSAIADGSAVLIMAGSHPSSVPVAWVRREHDGKAVVRQLASDLDLDAAKYAEAVSAAIELLA